MQSSNVQNYFNTRLTYDSGRAKVWSAINEYLQHFLPARPVVMDVGCGYGDFINGIKAEKKYAVDLNETMPEYFTDKNIEFTAQSVLDEFPVKNESLDVIFASNLFEHFDDEELSQLMTNVRNKLKKGGRLVLLQPNFFYAYREYWDDYTHKKAFSHNSIADFLVANNFRMIHLKKKFLPFSLKSRLPKSYWLTKMYLLSPIKPMGKQMLIIAEKN